MVVVFNTSPVIFLSKLEYLERALDIFDEIYIPDQALIEISAKDDKVRLQIGNLIETGKVTQKTSKLTKLFHGLNVKIGRGESEAIALAIEGNADYVILDDFVARKEAEALGLSVKGTLGIIKKLIHSDLIRIDDFDLLYKKLVEIKFRVKKEIFLDIFHE